MDVNSRSSHRRCSIKVDNLKISQNSLENTCVRVSFLIKLQALTCNFIKKEALAQVFFCEFYEIFKNTFFYRTPTGDCFFNSFIFCYGISSLPLPKSTSSLFWFSGEIFCNKITKYSWKTIPKIIRPKSSIMQILRCLF